MRIACIHLPQFALQCASRLDPSLRGEPVIVVSGAEAGRSTGPLHAPVVTACSRAAWALGVRLGMTAVSARRLSSTIHVVTAEAGNERETIRAIADAMLALTDTVDLGGRVGAGGAHLAMYAEVPARMRGTTFGDRLLEVLEELGVTGRIGIADDRFTAWVAAAHAPCHLSDRPGLTGAVGSEEKGVVSVPRGGSAAFLSPRPLSLLAISPEVQHMLEALGVRTLGEFAALPAPSVARPIEADYQALARGESGTTLRPYVPEAPIREEIVVSGDAILERPGSLSGLAAVALVARRVELRLQGRGRGAGQLDVTAIADGEARELPVTIDHPITDADGIARVLTPALDELRAARAGSWRMRVVVAGEAAATGETHEIFAEGSSSIYASSASAPINPIAVVLSTAGSLFTLAPPDVRAERRDAHRRTRRGKQRRHRPATLAQPRLFERESR